PVSDFAAATGWSRYCKASPVRITASAKSALAREGVVRRIIGRGYGKALDLLTTEVVDGGVRTRKLPRSSRGVRGETAGNQRGKPLATGCCRDTPLRAVQGARSC